MNRFSVLGVCVLGVLVATAFALEIQVAPSTLVLSSNGGKLTVHTDEPFSPNRDVTLEIEGTEVEVHTFADDCGNLVAQCTKEAAAEAIGEFNGMFTYAKVTLTVDGDSATETIRVRK